MEGNIAATYTLVYRFLKQQSQYKAAEAVKKAAKTFVVIRDDIEQEGLPLEDIVKEWRAKENTKSEDTDSSSEDSGSSDDSSSDSKGSSSSDSSSEDTSDSDDDTSDSDDSSGDEETRADKLPPKVVESDTSATLSSVGEDVLVGAGVIQKLENKSTTSADKPTKKSSESDSSDSSDSGGSSKSSASDGSDTESPSSSSDHSNGSDSSDEDEASANEKAPPKTKDKSPSTSESSSDSEDESDLNSQKENAPAVKRRKTSKDGVAVTTAVAAGLQQIARASQRKEKPPPKVKERFQRVKVQNVAPDLVLDNGYQARGGVANDYGERAHRDLIVTRGAGFRKEKNKKKRGSYRGGEITMENHSIKFDF